MPRHEGVLQQGKLTDYPTTEGVSSPDDYCQAQSWNTDDAAWTTYASAWCSDARDEKLAVGETYLGIRYGGRAPLESGAPGVSEFVVVGSLPVGCGFKWGTEAPNIGKLLHNYEEMFDCGFELPEDDCGLVTIKASDLAGAYLTGDGCILDVELPDIVTDLPLYTESAWVLTGAEDYTCQTLEVVTGVEMIEDVLTVQKKWITFVGKVSDTEPDTCCGEAVCAAIIPGVDCPDCEADPCSSCECDGLETLDVGANAIMMTLAYTGVDGGVYHHEAEMSWLVCLPDPGTALTVSFSAWDFDNFAYGADVGESGLIEVWSYGVIDCEEGALLASDSEILSDHYEEELGAAAAAIEILDPPTVSLSDGVDTACSKRIVKVRMTFDSTQELVPAPTAGFTLTIS